MGKRASGKLLGGGCRQRRKRNIAAAAEAAVDDSDDDASSGTSASVQSVLAKTLLFFWSWGFISLVFTQKIASAAAEDFKLQGCNAPADLMMLAKLGTSGRLFRVYWFTSVEDDCHLCTVRA
jgi:hypothetical protein